MVIKIERFYTTRQAAEMLGISRQTLQVWVREGKANPAITLGGHYRFALKDVNEIRKSMGLPLLEEPIENEP
jgi:excisionase family DNA binding protein